MKHPTTLFGQALSLIDRADFARLVRKHRANSLHPGLEAGPKRSTLSWSQRAPALGVLPDVFYHVPGTSRVLGSCRAAAPGEKRGFRLGNKLPSLDPTVIELCGEIPRLGPLHPRQGHR